MMQKVVVVVASVFVVMFGSAAFAAESFVLDDSAFDYFGGEAYVTLEYEDGDFLVHLENEASDGALELAELEDNFPEAQSDRDGLSDRELQASLPVDVDDASADIMLESNNLQVVTEQFDAQMESLGFEGEVEDNGPNRTIKVYDTGESQTRVVFSQQGNDVNVYMHAL